jgi:predicted RNase H-like HicB family nuclease
MDLPTLHLTYSVLETSRKGIFIGKINEIGGIFAQADSPTQVRDDLVRTAGIMIPRYKQQQAIDLLVKQQQERLSELFAPTESDAANLKWELSEVPFEMAGA